MEKKVNDLSELVSKDEVAKKFDRIVATSFEATINLLLAFVDRYGDEAWEIAEKYFRKWAEQKALRVERLMKEAGSNFNDPREVRRYSREDDGFWGFVEHTDDKVVVKPDGKVRVEYRNTKCPMSVVWRDMDLSKELQLKLDTIWPSVHDTTLMKHFNVKYECDQGMAQGKPWCKFVLEKL